MKISESSLTGCYQIEMNIHKDARGHFFKSFNLPAFEKAGLEFKWAESFYSVSRKGVLRGLHFQLPPHQHAKLVSCINGRFLDVVVDLRRNSPTEGRHEIFELNSERGNQVYIPPGCAHGCYALTDGATIFYHVSSPHAPEYDAGIHWDSVGIPWPDKNPIISDRDQKHPRLKEFQTPFVYKDIPK